LGLIWLKEVEMEHEGVRREEEGVSLFFCFCKNEMERIFLVTLIFFKEWVPLIPI
jgi:hypothetical protein